MRAVKGEVTSSNPVSLSKAATVLSRFAISETGALPDVAAYLKHAAAAFNELVSVHGEIRALRKISHFEEKEDNIRLKNKKKMKKVSCSEGEACVGNSILEGQEEMSRSKKKKGEALGDEQRSEERRYQEVGGVGLVSENMNTERKKRKQGEVDAEMERREGKRKNKRRTIE